jgi:hypothetical protein
VRFPGASLGWLGHNGQVSQVGYFTGIPQVWFSITITVVPLLVPGHNDGIPDCETSTARVRTVKSLSRWPRDSRCFAVKAAVCGLRTWDEGNGGLSLSADGGGTVPAFLVVRGT